MFFKVYSLYTNIRNVPETPCLGPAFFFCTCQKIWKHRGLTEINLSHNELVKLPDCDWIGVEQFSQPVSGCSVCSWLKCCYYTNNVHICSYDCSSEYMFIVHVLYIYCSYSYYILLLSFFILWLQVLHRMFMNLLCHSKHILRSIPSTSGDTEARPTQDFSSLSQLSKLLLSHNNIDDKPPGGDAGEVNHGDLKGLIYHVYWIIYIYMIYILEYICNVYIYIYIYTYIHMCTYAYLDIWYL